MYFNVMLPEITGSINLRWFAVFPVLSEPSLLDIFMKSEFSERRFLTISHVAPAYGGLQYSQETSELYEFRW